MIGNRLGPYEITAKLGEGGMGEVYRATDTKLKREVAIKVLPAAFTEDRERLARFEREAQLLAQLHHPHIASIFGMEESDGTRALVMELVEGPTLAERLEAGPLPPPESLAIALQIAQALEEAHEKGIVHRDLKPQNVKVTADGKVKVLDFGLAKAMDPSAGAASSASQLAQSPTITLGATAMGVILGTAAYMAPEQARGLPVDKRADIWAFGVVVYEMLTGRVAFAAETVPDTLAAVLTREIDWSALPAATPSSLRTLLRRCLERNVRNRMRDIGDARIVLAEAIASPEAGSESAAPSPAAAPRSRAGALPWAFAAAALAVAAWALATRPAGSGSQPRANATTYLEVSMPPGVEAVQGISGGFGLSPDGRTLGLIGVREGTRRLYTRSLDEPEAAEVSGSSGINSVAFSPDGASVAFVVGTLEVVRYSIADRQRQVVASGADLGSTVAWGESGIYFSRDGAIWRVPATGGAPERVTQLDAGRREVIHIDPVEPPGSGRLYFTSLASGSEATRIESVALVDGARSVVLERAATPVWSPSGHLLFEREGAVWAVRLDARRGVTSGRAVRVLEAGLLTALRYGSLPFRVSATGTLAYLPREFDQKRMVAVDRRGAELAFAIPPDSYGNPRPSPDGRRILFERGSLMEVLDVERGTKTQLVAAAFGTNFGTWSSDGRYVVLRRFNTPHWVATDGSGRMGEVPGGSVNDYPHAPGPDPDSFLAVRVRPDTAGDIFLFSINGAFAPRPLVATPAYEGGAELSPDRKWLVYQSNESGRPEIYVRRYPQLDRAWQVSEGGGVQPRWSADGREIYYRTGGAMMAASFAEEGGEPRLGRPLGLFADEYDFGQGLSVPNYDVLPGGRFVFFRRTPAGGRLRLVQNWRVELERKLAAEGER